MNLIDTSDNVSVDAHLIMNKETWQLDWIETPKREVKVVDGGLQPNTKTNLVSAFSFSFNFYSVWVLLFFIVWCIAVYIYVYVSLYTYIQDLFNISQPPVSHDMNFSNTDIDCRWSDFEISPEL